MLEAFPIPIQFRMPNDEWVQSDPSELGLTNAAFAAVRRGFQDGYAPVLTVSGGWRTDAASFQQIADESLEVLEQDATDVELVKRTEVGRAHAPAIAQSLAGTATYEGRRLDLRRFQAITGIVDVNDPIKRFVIIYSLTCLYRQSEQMKDEFQEFMSTVQVLAPSGDGDADREP
ncbi:hypothetical protein ACFV9G_17205 [Nocardioides sp. NPDC059952]|uniref:hypothetical protein n=1 Tax=Nocardioides sp. NPDC059952 TaxID=3347014 RepID=UPI00364B8267